MGPAGIVQHVQHMCQLFETDLYTAAIPLVQVTPFFKEATHLADLYSEAGQVLDALGWRRSRDLLSQQFLCLCREVVE
jgi:hypothetical protein